MQQMPVRSRHLLDLLLLVVGAASQALSAAATTRTELCRLPFDNLRWTFGSSV